MPPAHGASQDAWNHFSETLGLTEHLLPVVANPDATISPDSHMKALGKTPSRYNFRGEVSGFAKWTEMRASHRDVGKWELEPDYGICVQARALRAIDIDVPSENKARRIVRVIEEFERRLGVTFPRRYREGTGKVLLPFRYEGVLPKRVLQVDGGVIEILGDGQQWIAESTYIKDGKADGRYLWLTGWPKTLDDVPLLAPEVFEDLCDTLDMTFGEEPWSIARVRREGSGPIEGTPGLDDPVYDWLLENWEVHEALSDGRLFIDCPWKDQHTGDSGPSETQYAVAGSGGYELGHFKCLHAHCMKRERSEFLEAMGWSPDLSDAPIVEPEPETGTEIEKVEPDAVRYQLTKEGRKERTAYNHELFLRDAAASGMHIAWDDYTAQLVWRAERSNSLAWQPFEDHHYQRLLRAMDRYGFQPQSAESIRSAVHSYGVEQRVDTFKDWVGELPAWDGVERVETFWIVYGKAEDTPFTRAVGRYSFSAQVARALAPGCQVDMVPILVGPQGARKTSLVRAIAPSIDHFGEIDLNHKDDDMSRKMRGKAVIELSELRGLRGREKESTKAIITRIVEEWIGKYKEFASKFLRRFVMYGTTNEDSFLADSTGERRWLPFEVGIGGKVLDVEGVERDREQLWAEAVHRYNLYGIEWEDAERLACGEHEKFKEHNHLVAPVARYLLEDDPLRGGPLVDQKHAWTIADILPAVVNKRPADITKNDEIKVGEALRQLGGLSRKKRGYRGRVWSVDRAKVVEAARGWLDEDDDLFG